MIGRIPDWILKVLPMPMQRLKMSTIRCGRTIMKKYVKILRRRKLAIAKKSGTGNTRNARGSPICYLVLVWSIVTPQGLWPSDRGIFSQSQHAVCWVFGFQKLLMFVRYPACFWVRSFTVKMAGNESGRSLCEMGILFSKIFKFYGHSL